MVVGLDPGPCPKPETLGRTVHGFSALGALQVFTKGFSGIVYRV